MIEHRECNAQLHGFRFCYVIIPLVKSLSLSLRQSKVNKVKFFLPFQKFMKRPQTKFHADTMSHSKVIRSKKSKFIVRSKITVRPKFFCSRVFFFIIDILLKLQQQILICFCKFSCNSEVLTSFVTTSDVIMLFSPLLDD